MTPRKSKKDTAQHQFGGEWTSQKLEILAKYLQSYTLALKNKPTDASPFRKAYIDAFAGSGYRDPNNKIGRSDSTQNLWFPELAKDEPQALLDGSAKRALQIEPPFDRYIFIERNVARCKKLEELKIEFPKYTDRIDIQQGDANAKIKTLCAKKWESHRAVLFLDPYGMQVEWNTIEAVAKTKAIDLWILFPLGIAVNRMLTKSGKIPKSWRTRLDRCFGTTDWYNVCYSIEKIPTLFGTEQKYVIKENMEKIGHYFNERLKTIFAGVADKPGVLRNSSNSLLYLLCFAVGNERGKDIALRIAKHLLRNLQ